MSMKDPNITDVLREWLVYWFGRSLYKDYMRGLGLEGDEKVLDFGCGGGACARCILEFLSKGGALTCVDISEFWLPKAEKRMRKYDNAEFVSGEISELGVEDSSYDVVFIHFVLHDIERGQRETTVDALFRKLKPGGHLFIREPTKESHGMPAREVRDLMKAAGLREDLSEEGKSILLGPMYAGRYSKTV